MAALEHVGISSIELDKQMTREQFAVFFVKLIDRNETALKEQFQHPFTDSTPDGDPYLGYVYARWYYTGTEDYSASGNITGKEVLLAILRAMGYSDNRGGTDFSADDPSVLAASLGLTVPDDDIRGEDIAALVWQALGAKTKDEKTFADKLDIDDDLIKEAEYLAKGQPIPSPSPSPSPSPKKEKEPQKENNNSGGGNSGGGNSGGGNSGGGTSGGGTSGGGNSGGGNSGGGGSQPTPEPDPGPVGGESGVDTPDVPIED